MSCRKKRPHYAEPPASLLRSLEKGNEKNDTEHKMWHKKAIADIMWMVKESALAFRNNNFEDAAEMIQWCITTLDSVQMGHEMTSSGTMISDPKDRALKYELEELLELYVQRASWNSVDSKVLYIEHIIKKNYPSDGDSHYHLASRWREDRHTKFACPVCGYVGMDFVDKPSGYTCPSCKKTIGHLEVVDSDDRNVSTDVHVMHHVAAWNTMSPEDKYDTLVRMGVSKEAAKDQKYMSYYELPMETRTKLSIIAKHVSDDTQNASEPEFDMIVLISPLDVHYWTSKYPGVKIIDILDTNAGSFVTFELPTGSYSAHFPEELRPILKKYGVGMPEDDIDGIKKGTVWAGNLALNWADKMSKTIGQPDIREELAAAMFLKLLPSRADWENKRIAGINRYVREAVGELRIKTGRGGRPSPPPPAMPRATPPPTTPTAPGKPSEPGSIAEAIEVGGEEITLVKAETTERKKPGRPPKPKGEGSQQDIALVKKWKLLDPGDVTEKVVIDTWLDTFNWKGTASQVREYLTEYVHGMNPDQDTRYWMYKFAVSVKHGKPIKEDNIPMFARVPMDNLYEALKKENLL